MSPVGEKLTLIPSFTYNMMFSEGSFKNRSDKTYNLGLVASYAVYEWLNATAMSNTHGRLVLIMSRIRRFYRRC